MDIEQFREYCLSVKGAEECMPFNDRILVYKVMGKMFTFASLQPKDGHIWANMKCDPEKSAELREQYTGISFGFYSDKKYWITVRLESDVPNTLIRKLPKNKQATYRSIAQ